MYTIWELFGKKVMKENLVYFSKIKRGIKYNLSLIVTLVFKIGLQFVDITWEIIWEIMTA